MPNRRSLLLATALLPLLPLLSHAQTAPRKHRLVIQVTDNDPARWNLALNNTKAAQVAVGGPGNIDIEVVTYGPGVHMLKKDSAVSERIAEMAASGVKFAACNNTMRALKLEKSDMLTTAEIVPAGVVELMTRQEEGWSYLRP